MNGIVFSKQVFKAAYAAQVIGDEHVWLDMLASRNVTSHVYDDAQAANVVTDIRERYIKISARRILSRRRSETIK